VPDSISDGETSLSVAWITSWGFSLLKYAVDCSGAAGSRTWVLNTPTEITIVEQVKRETFWKCNYIILGLHMDFVLTSVPEALPHLAPEIDSPGSCTDSLDFGLYDEQVDLGPGD
jgi:hypothetical protein